ncbi:MAG: hypothetical protein M3Q97_04480 [Bacteroidota bacterium]|nr:hypothetical protein [Bacteroidota bacterium]
MKYIIGFFLLAAFHLGCRNVTVETSILERELNIYIEEVFTLSEFFKHEKLLIETQSGKYQGYYKNIYPLIDSVYMATDSIINDIVIEMRENNLNLRHSEYAEFLMYNHGGADRLRRLYYKIIQSHVCATDSNFICGIYSLYSSDAYYNMYNYQSNYEFFVSILSVQKTNLLVLLAILERIKA